MQKDQTWARWIKDIGLPWVGNFMTDFPVFWWRDMLPDMREWMVRKTLGAKMSDNRKKARDEFWRAYQKLFRETPGGHSCEYCILLNFAHSSDKWRDRYDWRVAPSAISLGMSLHQHGCGCPRKAEVPNSLREVLLFYPYALRTHFDRSVKRNFRTSDWWWREFLSRPFLAHWQRGPVASNTTVRNVGSDLNAKERFSKNGFNHSIWAAYERGGDRQPWFQMLRAHDAAIERWRRGGDDGGGEVVAAEKGESSESGDGGAGARSRPMSHVEKTPSIAAGWQQCFAVPDNACKHQNNTGHNTGAGAGGHRNLL